MSQYARQLKMALAQSLMPQQGGQIRTPMEGIGRLGQTFASVLLQKQVMNDMEASRTKASQDLMRMLSPVTEQETFNISATPQQQAMATEMMVNSAANPDLAAATPDLIPNRRVSTTTSRPQTSQEMMAIALGSPEMQEFMPGVQSALVSSALSPDKKEVVTTPDGRVMLVNTTRGTASTVAEGGRKLSGKLALGRGFGLVDDQGNVTDPEGFLDLLKATSDSTNITVHGDKTMDQEFAKSMNAFVTDYDARTREGRKGTTNASLALRLIDQGTPTGTFVRTKNDVQKVINGLSTQVFGMEAPFNQGEIASIETVDAALMQNALGQVKLLGTNPTDKDLDITLKANPGIGATRAFNQIMLERSIELQNRTEAINDELLAWGDPRQSKTIDGVRYENARQYAAMKEREMIDGSPLIDPERVQGLLAQAEVESALLRIPYLNTVEELDAFAGAFANVPGGESVIFAAKDRADRLMGRSR